MSKIHQTLDQNQKLFSLKPELRLYENFLHEACSFVAPEESLRAEYTRLLAHPSLVLNVIPEKLSNRHDSGGIPEQLRFPDNDEEKSTTAIRNSIRNMILLRYLCEKYKGKE
jgi:hypothetical protein